MMCRRLISQWERRPDCFQQQGGCIGAKRAKRAKHRRGAPLFYIFGKTARKITPSRSRACRPSRYLLNIISVMLNTSLNACTMQNFTPPFPREFAAPTPTPPEAAASRRLLLLREIFGVPKPFWPRRGDLTLASKNFYIL